MPRNRGGTCDPWGAHVVTDNRREQLDERGLAQNSFDLKFFARCYAFRPRAGGLKRGTCGSAALKLRYSEGSREAESADMDIYRLGSLGQELLGGLAGADLRRRPPVEASSLVPLQHP